MQFQSFVERVMLMGIDGDFMLGYYPMFQCTWEKNKSGNVRGELVVAAQ